VEPKKVALVVGFVCALGAAGATYAALVFNSQGCGILTVVLLFGASHYFDIACGSQ
jgi:hypothetical protein